MYSDAFAGLPECGKEYVYSRLADVLSGRDQSTAFAHLSDTDRKQVLEILTSTQPGFAKVAKSAL